jgi:hypothetical protein
MPPDSDINEEQLPYDLLVRFSIVAYQEILDERLATWSDISSISKEAILKVTGGSHKKIQRIMNLSDSTFEKWSTDFVLPVFREIVDEVPINELTKLGLMIRHSPRSNP